MRHPWRYLVTLSSLEILKNLKKLYIHACSWLKLWMKLVWFYIIIMKMTLFWLLFAGAIVRYHETKRKLYLQSLPENQQKTKQSKQETKVCSRRKRVCWLELLLFFCHCMCKKHQPIIVLYSDKLQLIVVLTLKWPSGSPISLYCIY